MNRTPFLLVLLVLALLGLGHAAAQGPPDQAGPPDHANNEAPPDSPDQATSNPPAATGDDNEDLGEDPAPHEDTTEEDDAAPAPEEDTTEEDPAPSNEIGASTPSSVEDEKADEDEAPLEAPDADEEPRADPPLRDPLPEGPTPIQDTVQQRPDATMLPTGPLEATFTPPKEASRTQSTNAPSSANDGFGWFIPSLFMFGLGALATVALRSPQPTKPKEEDVAKEGETLFQPQPGLEGLLMLGKNAVDHGDTDAAIGWFETAIALKPDLQAAHFCMGLCLDDAGHLDQAQDALANAHTLNPNDPLTRYAHASVLARQGATQQALHHVHRIAQDLPALTETMLEDDEFAPLHDHPRFLALLGEL